MFYLGLVLQSKKWNNITSYAKLLIHTCQYITPTFAFCLHPFSFIMQKHFLPENISSRTGEDLVHVLPCSTKFCAVLIASEPQLTAEHNHSNHTPI